MDDDQQQQQDLQEQEEMLTRAIENIYMSVPKSVEDDVKLIASALGLSFFKQQRRAA